MLNVSKQVLKLLIITLLVVSCQTKPAKHFEIKDGQFYLDLQDYAKEKSCFNNKKILIEIEARKYEKPSDWMFAEMKVKELEQSLSNNKIKQI